MPRLLYIYHPETGHRFIEQDVTGLSEREIFQVEFHMRCKWDLYGVFVDTDKDGDLAAVPLSNPATRPQS